MKTKNAMQLKALIRNRAKDSAVTPQLIMQNYLIERIMERIALSPWHHNIVIKGGMLISSLIGVDKRSTKDLDTTVQGFPLTHKNAEAAFREIINIDIQDDFVFELVRTEDIREADDYPGIRVHLTGHYEQLEMPVTIDVTTGDKITPKAITYDYPLLFEDRTISLMTYPLATTMAEKLETVISRDTANTRLRDYYDLHMLWATRSEEIDLRTLEEALAATSEKRGSRVAMNDYQKVMERIAHDERMQAQWSIYARKYPYVKAITLQDTCDTIVLIMRSIGW